MKTLKAKKDFSFNGMIYLAGEEVKVNDIETVRKMNEKGFIEPLNLKELTILERELKNKNMNEEE